MSQNKKLRNAIAAILQAGHGVDMRADLSVYPSEGSFLVECFLGDESLDFKGLNADQMQQATETGEIAEYYPTAEEAADGYLVLVEWLEKAIQKSAQASQAASQAGGGKGKKEPPAPPPPAPVSVGLADMTLADLDELTEGPALVLLLAPWNAVDRQVLGVVEGLVKAFPEVQFGRISIDEEPDVMARFDVTATPTVLLFNSGEVVHQASGSMKEKELRAALEKVRG